MYKEIGGIRGATCGPTLLPRVTSWSSIVTRVIARGYFEQSDLLKTILVSSLTTLSDTAKESIGKDTVDLIRQKRIHSDGANTVVARIQHAIQ